MRKGDDHFERWKARMDEAFGRTLLLLAFWNELPEQEKYLMFLDSLDGREVKSADASR